MPERPRSRTTASRICSGGGGVGVEDLGVPRRLERRRTGELVRGQRQHERWHGGRQRLGDAVVPAVGDHHRRPAQQRHLGQHAPDQPGRGDRPEVLHGGGSAGERYPDVELSQRCGDPSQHVGAHGQEAPEADVDDGCAAGGQPRVDLGVRYLAADRGTEERVARQESGALGGMELRRVVEQQHVAGLGERVVARGRRRVEGVQGVVPARGEGVPYPNAQAVEAVERIRVRREAPGPLRRVAVDLVTDGQGRRVPEDHVRVPDARARQGQPGAERQVVDEDVVRADPVDDGGHLLRDLERLPEQVVASSRCLEGERLDRSAPRGVEEAAKRLVLAAGLVLRPDDARVGPSTQLQVLPLEAEPAHDLVGGRAGGHDDALPGLLPGGGQCGERVEVRRVVRADDQERHGATFW